MHSVNSKSSSPDDWLLISGSRSPTPEGDWDLCSNLDQSTYTAAKSAAAKKRIEIESIKKIASCEFRPINPDSQVSNNVKQAAIAPMPRPITPSHHFFSLRLNTEDEAKIQILIKDLAEKSFLELGTISISLSRRGAELKVVHPMRFMGHILSNPTISNHLEALKKKSFTYNRFSAEFVGHMKEKEKTQDLLIHADGFAKHVGVETQAVVNVINSKRYADLIDLKRL